MTCEDDRRVGARPNRERNLEDKPKRKRARRKDKKYLRAANEY